MIFAVAMTFIDQTIVSIAVPEIQKELGLSATGVQWAVNAYLLSLAAFFAFGGRLADTVGHRKMAMLGVVVFAGASALCGLTPKGSLAEAWIVTFRAVQGLGGAIMFPAALAIVVQTFPLRERGKALATFFGIAGGLTAVGPILGGYLTQWTWRAIFWVNIPVAIIALVLIVISKPTTAYRAAKMDYRGLVLIASGVAAQRVRLPAVLHLGLAQSRHRAVHRRGTGPAGGLRPGGVAHRSSADAGPHLPHPRVPGREPGARRVHAGLHPGLLLRQRVRGQISLGKSASQAGIFLLYFFIGFAVAAQIGGRMLDRGGAKRPVVLGCVLAAVGFYLWAGKVTGLSFSNQQWYIILAGAGMGFMLGPASTDAVNRASRLSYGEATGITQTVRNYSASLGLAILGTVLVTEMRSRLTTSLVAQGVPRGMAATEAARLAQSQGSSGSVAVHPPLLPPRLRLRHPQRLLRDGRGHGRRRRGGDHRPAGRPAGGSQRGWHPIGRLRGDRPCRGLSPQGPPPAGGPPFCRLRPVGW